MSLNPSQAQAVTHKDGPCMVLAGPGSGKTLTITKRIEYLIEKHHVKPEEILVITFTKAASVEMKERFFRLRNGKPAPVTFGTFHGIYYGILKWAYRMNAGNILSEEEKYKLLKQVIGHMEIDIDDEKDFMLGFKKDYPDTKEILLDVNYRSTKAIVNGASRVIRHNVNRYPKKIVTTNEQGETVHIQEVRDSIEESKYVIRQIQEAKKRGIPASEIAVLFRTNVEARTLAETFMEYNMPFRMKERVPNLYEHFIAQDLITYLKMALGDRGRKSFLAIMNRPNRYIGRDSVEGTVISFESLRQFYCDKDWMLDRIDQLEVDLRILKNMAPYGAIQYIRKHIGYDEFLKEYAVFRKINMEDLKEVLREIEERAKAFRTIKEWFAHIEEYTEEIKRQSQQKEADPEAVTFMTMHGSKGLEFDLVFIIGANETITPYKKAETKEEVEEERRMFYVAMTRARKKLVISYTKERNGKAMSQSRFVGELLTRL